MRRMLASDEVARLARSAERLVQLAQAINDRATEWDAAPPDPGPMPAIAPTIAGDPLIQIARDAMRVDRNRPDFGAPALFQARSWTLVLELFIADASGVDISVKAACLLLGGSQTSALRTILQLEQVDVVVSRADASDGRRRLLSLSERARGSVSDYLARLHPEPQRPLRLSLRMTTHSIRSVEPDERHVSSGDRSDVAPFSARSESGTEMISQ